MKIVQALVRPCLQAMRDTGWKFARGALSHIEGHVLVLSDEDGHTGLGYVHAIPAISGPGAANRAATEWFAQLAVGREIDDRLEALHALLHELDARLAFNASARAALDMALHDLLARRLNRSLATLLGGARRASVSQSRLIPIKPPAEMAATAVARVIEGYRQVKLKLSGESKADIARVAAVRETLGPDIVITLDPNQAYAADDFIDAFRHMERHLIALVEQPVPATDMDGLARIKRAIGATVEADESAQSVDDIRRLIAANAAGCVNLKITKLGGIRRFLEAARLCADHGLACRVGAAFGPGLLQAFAVHAASTLDALPYACETSEHEQLLDDPFTPVPVVNGEIAVPAGAGCGVEYRAATGTTGVNAP